jgi:hypothetical protein
MMVPVIEVGAVPVDAVIIEPGGSKFGLETFAEASFGLGIDVDAFGDVVIHVNSWSVLIFERSGRLKSVGGGNGDLRDCRWLVAELGRAGWASELFPGLSQFDFAARLILRR